MTTDSSSDYGVLMTNAKPTPAKSTAIVAARYIVAGDVDFARKLLGSWVDRYRHSYTPAEGRALIGACREANRRYGSRLDHSEIMFG